SDSPSPKTTSPRTAAGLRARRAQASSSKASAPSRPAGNSGMMRIYTDDSPGIKVDPVVVLVGSLTFIASVFLLHIVGKYMRA
ncbi:Protein transport protein Sec61 subunit beta, partial [Quaeritorhiza haematococci]